MKYFFISKTALFLFLLIFPILLVSLNACNATPNPTTESSSVNSSVPDTSASDTTQDVPEPPQPGQDTDTNVRITVINGSPDNSVTEADYPIGESFSLTAAKPVNGYRFSHWEDSSGNLLGESETLVLTATKSEQYKAYYEVFLDTDRGNAIMTDSEQDWRQGAVNGALNSWTEESDQSRISFRTPYLLRAGDTMTIYLPTVVCCQTPGACPKLDGAGNCSLNSAFILLKKNESSNTGDITKDYTIVQGKWGTSYTAKEDTYIVIMVKWDKHGSEPFLLNGDYAKQILVTVSSPSDAQAGTPIGPHWKNELEDGIAKIQATRDNASDSLSEFFYLSDVHWLNNAQFSPALINYLAKKLDEEHIVFGGDVIEYHNKDKNAAIEKEIRAFYHAMKGYTKMGESLKIFTTIGNHDRNRADAENIPAIHIDEKTVYDLYIKQVEEFGVTRENDPNCSYFDDTENKVRYLQFYLVDNKYGVYTDSLTEAALNWAEERIMELSADWTVVLFTHGYWRYNSDKNSLDLFEKNLHYKERILQIKAAAAAEIACWIVGHVHVDHTEELTSDQTNETLRIIAFNSDSYRNSRDYKYNNTPNTQMKANTVTEQSFNFIQIDTVWKKIYVTRFGAGTDAVYSYGSDQDSDSVCVSAVNGTINGNQSSGYYAIGNMITLEAADAPAGYAFSHWENSAGETVGAEKRLRVAVTGEETYKAYYRVAFANPPQNVLSNTTSDWRQGAVNGSFTAWTAEADRSRISFRTPYLLKAGEVMTVTLPRVVCCLNPGDCPDANVPAGQDCILRAAFITLKRNGGTLTGDITKDYTIVKGTWTNTFEATEDTYVIVMIKWDKHGSEPFLIDCDYHKQVTVTVSHSENASPSLGADWRTELEDAIETIEINRNRLGDGLSEFIFLTDAHWKQNNQLSPAMINYLAEKTETDFMVFGGDLIEGHNETKQGAIDEEINSFYSALTDYTKTGDSLRIMTTLGNHDRNNASGNTDPNRMLTEQETYDLYYKRMEGWGVTVAGNPNASYYDDTANRVRYIQFFFTDSRFNMAEDRFVDAALAWAEERIKELSADWTVVLFTHAFYTGSGASEFYTDKTKEVASRMLEVQATAAAEIACWIVGHNHVDRREVLVSKDGKTTIPVISCMSDGKRGNANTVEGQSFSFVQVDTVNKKVYFTRIGKGEDFVISYGDTVEGTLCFDQ